MRSPGIVILDPHLTLRWIYEGTALGDYPSLDAVLERAQAIASASA